MLSIYIEPNIYVMQIKAFKLEMVKRSNTSGSILSKCGYFNYFPPNCH